MFSPEPMSGCWLWLGTVLGDGYGQVCFNGRRWAAHRIFYLFLKGPLVDGLVIDHKCKNTTCVNPDHLEQVTGQVNSIVRGSGPLAENYRKTHCKRGHPLSGSNLILVKRGRACRVCWEIFSLAWRVHNRERSNEIQRRYRKRKKEQGIDAR